MKKGKNHVDETPIPPGAMTQTTEQVICLNGPLEGVSGALAAVSSFVAACSSEPWFEAWAKGTNCGQVHAGLVLKLDAGTKGASTPPVTVLSN